MVLVKISGLRTHPTHASRTRRGGFRKISGGVKEWAEGPEKTPPRFAELVGSTRRSKCAEEDRRSFTIVEHEGIARPRSSGLPAMEDLPHHLLVHVCTFLKLDLLTDRQPVPVLQRHRRGIHIDRTLAVHWEFLPLR